MRKWCPEPFDSNWEEARSIGNPLLSFETATSTITPQCESPAAKNSRFEKDFALTKRNSLWDLMNQVEKEKLLDRAREMLQAEFETREGELRRMHQAELEKVKAEAAERLDNWSREFSVGLVPERHETAVEAAGLALALAGKIIRDTVEVDPEFLTRTLETALFKVRDVNPLTVILHPDDANLLQNNPDLMTRLRIGTVVSDRRVEKGGCRIRAGVREWDATLSRQMDALAEIVEETLAATSALAPAIPGDDDDSSLD
jgi:flagellar biosynthesis/type III secretory pathway protein FliH